MIPNLDVDLLKTFLAIADTGSFTRAAEEVNKTQSAVSMQMKRLEETLARPLFARDGRASRFTNDGEKLIEYARRLVALNDETVSAFTRPDLTRTVRFGTPDDYADRFLPEILARFSRTHPLVTVDVDCVMSIHLYDRVKNGEIDVALVTESCNVEADEVFLVLSGRGRVTFADGSFVELRPGVLVRLHAGDRTQWSISERLRKLYLTPAARPSGLV